MAYQKVFSALADPTRRVIFESLRDQPKSVKELAEVQTVSRPAVSQHLKVLEGANLVTKKPIGNRHLYLICRDGLNELQEYLDSFWSETLSAYAKEVERRVTKKGK